jgi:hypothetical protein
MAPVTVEALRRIAEEATKDVKSAVYDTTGFWLEPDLRCEFRGKDPTNDLQVEHLKDPVPHRTRLLFLYRCVYRDMEAVAEHSVSCNKVIMRGSVPLPPCWKAWLSVTVIPQKAAALASELGAEGLAQAEVHVLGAPKNGTPTCNRGFTGAFKQRDKLATKQANKPADNTNNQNKNNFNHPKTNITTTTT